MSLRRVSIWLAILALPVWFAAQQMEGFTYTLKYRDVRSVLGRITEELGKTGQVWVDGSANRITVQDDSSHMDKIRRLIQELDRPARHFALNTRMDILPKVPQRSLFKPTPSFVDMTQWSSTVSPTATYRCVMDLYEGQRATCALGSSYVLQARAQGYDPSRHRLALDTLSLTYKEDGGKRSVEVLDGAAVLREGRATLFLVTPSSQTPPLRLSIKPTLLPVVTRPEVR